MTTLPLWLLSCSFSPDPAPLAGGDRAADHLYRASILLRSAPPDPADVHRVRADPQQLEAVIRSYGTDNPGLGPMVRDLHAEALYVRWDTQHKPPAVGALAGYKRAEIAASLDEAPLRLIEHIVVEDLPYTEVVTADFVLADPIVSAAYGPPHDPDGPEWQVSHWPDGRPGAGILASTTLYQRHPTSEANYQRSRATVVASALFCDDVTTRAVAGAVDPVQQEDAIRTDPDCVACHAVLDPLASAFWSMRPYALPPQISDAHNANCEGPHAPFCYPLQFFAPELTVVRSELGLPPPALYGAPVDGLEDLGEQIAADTRFADCAARRFWSFLTRVPLQEVPDDLVIELSNHLVASDWSARELILTIATHPRFAPTSPDAPAAPIRPQHLARTLKTLTGYDWTSLPNSANGPVGLADTDLYGFQALMGGLQGWLIVGPEAGALPTRELAGAWIAEEAAQFAVDRELALPEDERLLLPWGAPTTEGLAREQLSHLHLVVLGEVLEVSSPEITRDWVFLQDLQSFRDAEGGWALLLSAMFQDPRLVVL